MKLKLKLNDDVLMILNKLEDCGYEAYVVGGCVRDSLMDITPKDWDICTSAMPNVVEQIFKDYKVLETGLKHGTVTVIVNDSSYEITTYRVDGIYEDNRHPRDVIFTSNIVDDLSRRDFTINAMAYSPTRGFVDCFGGRSDIKHRIIRCVGNPDTRFSEDGLRILRAVRFSIKYKFDIADYTLCSIYKNMYLLNNISMERINSEITQALYYGQNKLLMKCIETVIPEFTENKQNMALYRLIFRNKYNLPITLNLLLQGVTEDISATLKRLKYSNDVVKESKILQDISDDILAFIDYETPEYLAKYILNKAYAHRLNLIEYCVLKYITYDDSTFDYSLYEKLLKIERYLNNIPDDWCFTLKQLAISGDDVKNLGITNRDIGLVLGTVLDIVMRDLLPNNKLDLIDYIKTVIIRYKAVKVERRYVEN